MAESVSTQKLFHTIVVHSKPSIKKSVLVIKYLGGRLGINCPSAFVLLGQFQNF